MAISIKAGKFVTYGPYKLPCHKDNICIYATKKPSKEYVNSQNLPLSKTMLVFKYYEIENARENVVVLFNKGWKDIEIVGSDETISRLSEVLISNHLELTYLEI